MISVLYPPLATTPTLPSGTVVQSASIRSTATQSLIALFPTTTFEAYSSVTEVVSGSTKPSVPLDKSG